MTTLPFLQVLLGSETAMHEDINDYHVPFYRAVWRSIGNGHWPFWSHSVFAGQNLVGGGQPAVFYPLNAIFGVFGPVTAFRWWLFVHLWIAAAGAFTWSWWRWRSVAGATLSGFAYALNGFMILHLVHMPFVAGVAWLPWTFLGLELLLEGWSAGRLVLFSGALGMIAMTGHPQMLWMTLVALLLLALVDLVRSGRGLAPWLRIGSGVAIGLCLAAPQLIPQFLFSRTSVRPDLSIKNDFTYSDSPRHLLTLLVPHVMGGGAGVPGMSAPWKGGKNYHELANYLGISVAFVAVFGVVRRIRERRVVGLLVIIAFAVLTALAGHTIMGTIVYHVVPFAKDFRAWARYLLLANLAVASLAGLGVRELLSAREVPLDRLAISASVAAALILLVPVVTTFNGQLPTGGAGFTAVVIPVLFMYGAFGAIAMISWRPTWGLAALLLVCAVDLGTFALSSPWRAEGAPAPSLDAFYGSGPPVFGWPADAPGGTDRWVTGTLDFRNISVVKDMQGINGYDPLVQADFAKLTGLVSAGRLGNDVFYAPGWLSDVLRVTTLVADRAIIPTDPAWHDDGPVVGAVAGPVVGAAVGAVVGAVVGTQYERWTRTPRVADAYLVGNVRFTDFGSIDGILRSPATDLTTTVYVENGRVGGARQLFVDRHSPDAAGTVSGSMSSAGVGRYTIDATHPAVLVLSYAWLDGWSATVDGKAAPVTRADGVVLGITVPAGHHTVDLAFFPPGLTLGLILSALAVTAMLIALVWQRRRTRFGHVLL